MTVALAVSVIAANLSVDDTPQRTRPFAVADDYVCHSASLCVWVRVAHRGRRLAEGGRVVKYYLQSFVLLWIYEENNT